MSIKALEGKTLGPAVIDQDRAPLTSPVTLAVACAKGAGYAWAPFEKQLPDGSTGHAAFLDLTEQGEGGQNRRTVYWRFDHDSTVTFRPIAATEKIPFSEFWRRLHDNDWCERNPEHPIAYLAGAQRHHEAITHKLQATDPHPVYGPPLGRHVRITVGKRSYQGGDGRMVDEKQTITMPLAIWQDPEKRKAEIARYLNKGKP